MVGGGARPPDAFQDALLGKTRPEAAFHLPEACLLRTAGCRNLSDPAAGEWLEGRYNDPDQVAGDHRLHVMDAIVESGGAPAIAGLGDEDVGDDLAGPVAIKGGLAGLQQRVGAGLQHENGAGLVERLHGFARAHEHEGPAGFRGQFAGVLPGRGFLHDDGTGGPAGENAADPRLVDLTRGADEAGQNQQSAKDPRRSSEHAFTFGASRTDASRQC